MEDTRVCMRVHAWLQKHIFFYFKFFDCAAFHCEYSKLLEFYAISIDKYRIFEG
jgi:hypothetical protein